MDTDVCIIGAGIMGSSAAYYLSKSTDRRIMLIDRFNLANDYCSSNDVNRVFRYAYGRDEYYTRLAIESRTLWLELEKNARTRLLFPSELLLVQGQDDEWNKFNVESHATLKSLGLKTEELDKSEIQGRYPMFRAEHAFTDPYAGALLASKALNTFQDLAAKNGVKVIENRHITKISRAGQEKLDVQDDKGNRIRTRKAIVTIGPWSRDLMTDNLVRMTPTRQQVLYFQPRDPAEYVIPNFPLFFMDQYYGIPAVGTESVKISHMGRDTPTDPEVAKRTVDWEEIEICRRVLDRFIPDLSTGPLVKSKVCLYDMTRDKDFVLGLSPENPGIVYGYGFSGHGFKFAPLIGRILARLALGDPPGVDMFRFRPVR